MIARIIGRLLCLIGLHRWERSMFVMLNARVANFHCTRRGCRGWKEG